MKKSDKPEALNISLQFPVLSSNRGVWDNLRLLTAGNMNYLVSQLVEIGSQCVTQDMRIVAVSHRASEVGYFSNHCQTHPLGN